MAAIEELVKLAAGVLIQQLSTPYRRAFERRIGGVVVCGVLAGLAALTGLGCAVGALWLWLEPRVGNAEAGFLCALTLLVVAFFLGLGVVYFARRTPTKALTDVLGTNEFKAISGMVEKHIPELVIAAAIGGLIFSMRGRKNSK
jgi:hypothetical protein